MFPIRDDNPTLHASVVTFLIIAVNAVVWVFIQGAGFNPALAKSLCLYGLVPGELLGTLPPGTEIPLGQHLSCVVEGAASWHTLITSMFLHGGWLHIIGNMWFLAVFGDNVEDSMGSFRFVIFYLVCGLAAAAAQIGLNPQSAVPMVGASGAISGIMGAYVVLYPRAPVHMLVFLGFFITRIIVPAYFMIGYWFLLQLLGILPSLGSPGGGVAVGAHVGGFLAGTILIFLFRRKDRVMEKRATRVWQSWRRR